MQQANEMEKLVQELEENVNEMNSDIEKTVKVLLEVAEILDNHCKNCQIFYAVGRFSAVFCDCLGIAGYLVSLLTTKLAHWPWHLLRLGCQELF